MKLQIMKPVCLVFGGLTLAALFAASPATAQSSGAPAMSSNSGKAEAPAKTGDRARAEEGRQTAGQGSQGNMESAIQEAPRPGIPAGEKELQRLKRTPGKKSDGGTAVPPER